MYLLDEQKPRRWNIAECQMGHWLRFDAHIRLSWRGIPSMPIMNIVILVTPRNLPTNLDLLAWGEVMKNPILCNPQLIIMCLGHSPPPDTSSAASTEVSFLNPNYRPKYPYVIITKYDKLSAKMSAPDTAQRPAYVGGP